MRLRLLAGSQALSSNKIRSRYTPDIKQMNFQLRTACNKTNFPLLEAEAMWHSPQFDPKKGVVILATGWTTTVNDSDTIEQLAQAYNCRGDVNFVVSFDHNILCLRQTRNGRECRLGKYLYSRSTTPIRSLFGNFSLYVGSSRTGVGDCSIFCSQLITSILAYELAVSQNVNLNKGP